MRAPSCSLPPVSPTKPLFLNGNGTEQDGHFSGALENVANANTYTGTITLESNSTIGVDGSSSLTITNAGGPAIVQQGGPFSLDKEGTGTLVLLNADTYGGGTNVDRGVLNVENAGALGLAGTTTTVRDGAQLQLQAPTSAGLNISNENLVLSGSGINGTGALLDVNGNDAWGSSINTITVGADPNFAPSTSPAGTVAIGVANLGDSLTFNAPVGQSVATGITKLGAGTLVLDQSDTYTGTTYVNAGIVNIENSNALGQNDGNEIQRITTYDPLGTDTFQVIAGGNTTVALPFGASAVQVASAIDSPTVLGANAVTVAETTVFSGISEVQALTLAGAQPFVTTFNLVFNGSSTGPLNYSGNAATDASTILSALNTLTSIGGLPFPATSAWR